MHMQAAQFRILSFFLLPSHQISESRVTMMMVRVAAVSSSGALLTFALALLAINSWLAMCRARASGDVSSAIFVAASTILLIALLVTVRAVEDDGDRRRRVSLKALVWALSAARTVMFAHRVAGLAFAGTVWSMAAATVGGGFCLLFVHGGADAGVVHVAARQ